MKFIVYITFLLISGVAFAISVHKPKSVLSILVISNVKEKGHFGDRSQSVGISTAISWMLKHDNIDVDRKEMDVHDIAKIKADILDSNNKVLVVSSGDYGIEVLSELKKDKEISSKIMTIWSGHQEFVGLKSRIGLLDVVVLPEYTITDSLVKVAEQHDTDLISVNFLPHYSLNSYTLKKAYDRFFLVHKIPLDKPYTVVLFGGDAPDVSGKTLHIKDKEISEMAQKVSNIVKENHSTLIISNSYRTSEGQIKLFLDNIQAAGVDKYVFFDFSKTRGLYKALLYLVSRGNVAIVTGDSVSMIDESVQFSKKPVYVMEVSSMNENHKKHLEFMRQVKYAMLLSEYNEDNLDYKTPVFSARVIAKRLKSKILQFLTP